MMKQLTYVQGVSALTLVLIQITKRKPLSSMGVGVQMMTLVQIRAAMLVINLSLMV
jgi:hypothetical protein